MNRPAPHTRGARGAALLAIVVTSCSIDDRDLDAAVAGASAFDGSASGAAGSAPSTDAMMNGSAGSAGAASPPSSGIEGPAPIPRAGNAEAPGEASNGEAASGPRLSVDVLELTLGPSVVGQVALGIVTLVNTGGQPTPAIVASITGPDAAAFTIEPGACGPSLASAAQCALNVQFLPTQARAHTATLQVAAGVAGAFSVALNGTGLAPGSLAGSATQFDFGIQEVGTSSASFTWSITNTGNASTAAVTASTTSAEFTTSSDCVGVLSPQASCSVVVTFEPGSAGTHFGTISVGDGLSTATLSVTGSSRNRLTITKLGSGVGNVRSADGSIDCGTVCSALPDTTRVDLIASTSNGSDSIVLGWSEEGCEPTARACSVPFSAPTTVGVRFESMPNNLVFVSSRALRTTLGGLTPYDTACNEMASAAGINNAAGNGFIAGMSSSTNSLRRRLGSARGFRRMDGKPFSDTLADLFDQTLVYHAVRFNELGVSLVDYEYNTGTLFDGSPGDTCLDWTSASAQSATFGFTEGGPSGWTGGLLFSTCSSDEAILCMGNRKTAPLALETFTGKRMWLSNTPYQAGSMTPDAKCQSERPPGVTSAAAFVAYTSRAASAVLTPEANYIRPDGQLIGTGADVAARRLHTGIWTTADGNYPSTRVWVGANTPNDLATPDTNCSDWQDSGGDALTGVTSLSSTRFWTDGAVLPCSNNVLLYCVER